MKIDNCYKDNFERNFLIMVVISALLASSFWSYIVFYDKFHSKKQVSIFELILTELR